MPFVAPRHHADNGYRKVPVQAFAIRAVRVLAGAGISQFIDLGTGVPDLSECP